MRTTQVLCFVTLLLNLLISVAWSAPPSKKRVRSSNVEPTKTTLKVTQFTADFTKWVDEIRITSPTFVHCMVTTQQKGAQSVKYEVATAPWPSSPIAVSPTVVGTGFTSATDNGAQSLFMIEFQKFVPPKPPKAPEVLTYYVRATPLNASKVPIGTSSASVRVVYNEPPPPPVIFEQTKPDLSRIVFVSNRDGNAEIYSMRSDGSDHKRLTNDPLDDRFPAWDPAHTRTAFARANQIFVMKFDGSSPLRLTQGSYINSVPRWSPDGTRIAFSSRRDGNYDIYTMRADGSDVKRLTTDAAAEDCPTWSPDGTRIAFQSRRDGTWQIYVVGADGSGEKRLTNSAAQGGSDTGPAWAPDGRIAFARKADVTGIYIMNADGSGTKPYGAYCAELNMVAFSEVMDFAPDGSLVFHAAGTPGSNGREVYVQDAQGHVKRLTNFGPAILNSEPNW